MLLDTTDLATDRAAVRGSDLAFAAREVGAVWGGLFALGVGFGVLVAGHGLPWWLAPVISAVVFAGSVEFLLVGMLAVATPVATIALTALLVNSRHLFYGLSFPLRRVDGRAAKAYSVFALCDEAFALLSTRDDRELTSGRILWTQAGMHVGWVVGATAGGLAGATVLSGVEGLDFILIALFLVLTLDAFRARPDRLALGLAVGAAVAALVLAPGLMLLVAMTGYAAALVVRHHLTRAVPVHA